MALRGHYVRRLTGSLYTVLAMIIAVSSTAQTSKLEAAPTVNMLSEKQSASPLDHYLKDIARLDRVSGRLFEAALPLCKSVGRDPGLITHRQRDFPKHLRQAARGTLNIGKTPIIIHRRDNGPAGVLEIGDTLLDRENAPLEVNSADVQSYLAAGILRIERSGVEKFISVNAPRACAYRVHLKHSKKINAKISGGQISVTTAMMDFIETDDELAYIIGHELSHSLNNHMKTAILSGGLIGLAQKKMRAIETDADYTGLTLMAASEYDLNAASAFWQRLTKSNVKIKINQKARQKRLNDILAFTSEVKRRRGEGESLTHMQKPPR